jgi:predicted transposase/invertase (TIGR01784 family)
MRAEKTVNGISRDYRKFARKMAITKNRIDREYAELRAEKAEEKAKAEGLAEGHAEGMEKGLAEGQTKEKLEIARKMKAMEMSVSQISEATGLPPETIGKL